MIRRTFIPKYGPVTEHYSNGAMDGVYICDCGHDFILDTKNYGRMDWNSALEVAYAMDMRLPTKDEWETIDRHRDEVNEILSKTGGDTICNNFSSESYYWTSDECSSNSAWGYDGDCRKTGSYNKLNSLTLRLVRPPR